MKPLKVIYAGTPEFAAIAMESLLCSEHQIILVMTQPDRPAGRGLKLQASQVKQKALLSDIPVIQPTSLRLDGKFPEEAAQAKKILENLDFDVLVVAAYGLILPVWLLELAHKRNKIACINIHASLLPRWRGAAPIHRAIWSGDLQTGTTIMKMEEGLDTGPIILVEPLNIQALDTTGSLHDRLALQGGRLLIEVLDKIANQEDIKLTPQAEEGITYAEKIKKTEALIDWNQEAFLIDRQIRALNPAPGAFTYWQGEIFKVWLSEDISNHWEGYKTNNSRPGEIVEINEFGISVAALKGVIRMLEIQKAGAKKMPAQQFSKSNVIKIGDCLGE